MKRFVPCVLILAVCYLAPPAWAMDSASYTMRIQTMDSGHMDMESYSFTLHGYEGSLQSGEPMLSETGLFVHSSGFLYASGAIQILLSSTPRLAPVYLLLLLQDADEPPVVAR